MRKKVMKVILVLIILLAGISGVLFVYSEKVSKIEMVEKAKQTIGKLISEVVNSTTEETVLKLHTEVDLSKGNGKGGVQLSWEGIDATNIIFKAYQKTEDSDVYSPISTAILNEHIEPIKVLNVYPVSKVYNSTFKYSNGKTVVLPKSSALKVWMQGGTIDGERFSAYGKNPMTGEQAIYVTPVSSNEFNAAPEIVWDYDIVMFGTWDESGGSLADQPNSIATEVIEQYIKAGYGVLAGHDTIGYSYYGTGLNVLRKHFKIDIGLFYGSATKPTVDYETTWGYVSEEVEVKKKGLLTNFPYELSVGTRLTIPLSHTTSNAAKGNVWMELVDGYNRWGTTDNYSSSGGKGNPVYYLTTNNNTAMIQTGHSNCESTPDERKILANTLFYLKQVTGATASTDYSAQDLKSPETPIINVEETEDSDNIKAKVSFKSQDVGSTYSYYIEAYDKSDYTKRLEKSNICEETVTTGVKGYYYIVNNHSNNSDFDIKDARYTEDETLILDETEGKYIHIKAVDGAGNESGPSKISIELKRDVVINKYDVDDSTKLQGVKFRISKNTPIRTEEIKENGRYYFDEIGGKYVPNNTGKDATYANSYIKIDLTDAEKATLKVNAEIFSKVGYGCGAVIVTDKVATPEIWDIDGEAYNGYAKTLVFIEETVKAKDYSIELSGGKEYYLHFGYYYEGDKTTLDKFAINSIKINDKDYLEYIYSEYTTDEEGKIYCSLGEGEYIAEELKGIEGYQIPDSPVDFSITKSIETLNLDIPNSKKRDVVITKYDEDGITALSGTKLLIKNKNNDKNTILQPNGKYYFEEINGKYVPNNNYLINTTASSYIKLDLRAVDKATVKVNAEISSVEGEDFGYATITKSKNAPVFNPDKLTMNEEFISKTGDKYLGDYTKELIGGDIYYLHLGYVKYGEGALRDSFTINSIKVNDVEYIGKNIYTTDENGKINLKLDEGEYIVEEIEAPDGYKILESPVEFSVQGDETTEVNIQNKKQQGVVINNYAEDGETPLEGAKFMISESGVNTDIKVEDFKNNGSYYFEERNGKYVSNNVGVRKNANSYIKIDLTKVTRATITVNAEIFSELDCDFGYATITESRIAANEGEGEQFLCITGRQKAKDYSIQLEGKKIYYLHFGFIQSEKTADTFTINSIKIDGKDYKNYKEYVTDENGKINALLPEGEYAALETMAPNGYQLSENVKSNFTITKTESASLDFINYKKGYKGGALVINKYDEDEETPLDGAEFEVTKSGINKNIVTEEMVNSGTYYFEEKDGKYVSNNKEGARRVANSYVKIDLSKMKTSESALLTVNADIISQEDYASGYVTVTTKQDTPAYEFDEAAYGAEYVDRFIDIEGTVKATNYSVYLEGGRVYYLHLGCYLHEYNKGNAEFHVNKIEVSYRDYRDYLVYRGTTDTDGKLNIELNPGDYSVQETKAPEGYYQTKESKNITVEKDLLAELDFINYKNDANLIVNKKDGDDETPLEGAKFVLSEYGINTKIKTEEIKHSTSTTGIFEEDNGRLVAALTGGTRESKINANSYIKIDLSNLPEREYAKLNINAKLTSIRGWGCAYAVITSQEKFPTYDLDESKYGAEYVEWPLYLEEPTENANYKFEIPGGRVYYLHLGLHFENEYKGVGKFVINSITLNGYDYFKYNFKEYVTDKYGKVTASLEEGRYVATEIESPNGYKLTESPKNFNIVKGAISELDFVNYQKEFGELELNKKEANTEKPLEGAKFLISDSNIDTKIRVHDIEINEGYKYGFEKKNGKYIATGANNQTATSYIKIDLSKVAETTNVKIGVNARLENVRRDGYGYVTLTTKQTNPKWEFDEIVYRSEYADRFVDLEGNVGDSTYYVSVQGGKVYYLHFGYHVLNNDNGVGRFTINNVTINGIDHQKYNYLELVTNNEGKANVELLPGSYIVREIEAPTGYQLTESQKKFTITNKEKTEVTFENSIKDGNLLVHKYKGDGITPLSGAKFIISEEGINRNIKTHEMITVIGRSSFEKEGGKYIASGIRTDISKYDYTKHVGGCIKIDLSNVPENTRIPIIVNAKMSNVRGYGRGYATITDKEKTPDIDFDEASYGAEFANRFLDIDYTANSANYSVTVSGGKLYYLYLGYYWETEEKGVGTFTINSITVNGKLLEKYNYTEYTSDELGNIETTLERGNYVLT